MVRRAAFIGVNGFTAEKRLCRALSYPCRPRSGALNRRQVRIQRLPARVHQIIYGFFSGKNSVRAMLEATKTITIRCCRHMDVDAKIVSSARRNRKSSPAAGPVAREERLETTPKASLLAPEIGIKITEVGAGFRRCGNSCFR